MEDDILDQLKRRSLQEFLDSTNSKFYKWLKRIVLLNPSRVVQLSTYLLNLNIAHKYFSWLNTLIKEVPDLMPEDPDLMQI